jgi:hypothetical protein
MIEYCWLQYLNLLLFFGRQFEFFLVQVRIRLPHTTPDAAA